MAEVPLAVGRIHKYDILSSINMKKKTNLKKITIDNLASMVARGFEETRGDIKDVKIGLHSELKKVHDRLDDIDNRLGKIENNHERRLETIEDKIRIISTVLEKDLRIKLPKSF